MRTLLASHRPAAQEAIDLFVYRIGRELASLTTALGGLDAIVFTAGIGEHAAEIRSRVCADAQWIGSSSTRLPTIKAAPAFLSPPQGFRYGSYHQSKILWLHVTPSLAQLENKGAMKGEGEGGYTVLAKLHSAVQPKSFCDQMSLYRGSAARMQEEDQVGADLREGEYDQPDRDARAQSRLVGRELPSGW